jgi:hypothetical protein
MERPDAYERAADSASRIKRAIRRQQQNHRSRALLYNNQAAAAALFNHLIS